MRKPRIAIALGDPAGIGPEIVAKALMDPRLRALCEPIVLGQTPFPKRRMGRPSLDGGRIAIQALCRGLAFVESGEADALVTAPVSKESFAKAGLGFPGHTEWLARAVGAERIAMLMVAGPLRAILMTRHVPLADVSKQLTRAVVEESAELGFDFVRSVLKKRRPRLALCGVNPHAGDHGLIGKEELRVFGPALKSLRKRRIPVAGPFSSDSLFQAMMKGAYDLALAGYHDQGMIPLKVHAGDKLVNITLGLPFIRTSPGHGTAYDIAGKNRANPKPMAEAIRLAAEYSSSR